MATAILKKVFDIELVRTRDMEVLEKLDLIYDIGNGEFDHHQVDKEHRENGTPYAACGLIWRKFGKDAITARHPDLQEGEVRAVHRYADAVLVEGIDASDNGIRTTDNIIPTMCISAILGGFNPTWDSPASEDEAFNDAVDFASNILENVIDQKASTMKAKKFVVEAFNKRPRPELLILDRSYPWDRSLKEIDRNGEVLFVIYPREGEYLMQTVREGGIRRDRKSLPKAWAGKREGELDKIIGIDDAVFCHTARFIAGARSFESIMKMADLAINEPEEVVVAHGILKRLKVLLKRRVVVRLRKR
jgi:uncharacterized UPF0160 family protein